MYNNYILKVKGQYIIKRSFNNIEYIFGKCNSYEEAIKMIDNLDKNGWPLNTKNIINHSENEKIYNSEENFNFDIKVGKAYKHGFLVLKRLECYDLFPQLSYENGCDIILDGIKSKARLNFVPRLVIDKKNEELINHLKELNSIDPDQRRIVTLIKQKPHVNEENNYTELIEENKKLKDKIYKMEKMIEELYKFSKINEK